MKPHLWMARGLWQCKSDGLIYVARTQREAYLEWLRWDLGETLGREFT